MLKTQDVTSGSPAFPEELWRHVIDRAIRDTVSGDRRLRNEVIRWLTSDDFFTVCDLADMSPDALRKQFADLAKETPGRARYLAKHFRKAVHGKRFAEELIE